MTFLSPWMLAGAAAVGIPIAVHFFFKARYKPLPWGAMKFLREAIEQTSRRLKFQEWILLALRCLVLLLLAVALARLGQITAGDAGRGNAIDAVLVIDTSFSMGAQDGDKTRLDRAKEAALQVIDTLPQNSTVQIYTCADRTTLLGPISRTNLDQARELVKTIRPTGLTTDFMPGLTDALRSVDTGTAPVKEIYLFTDMHKLGFERQQGALKAKCEEIRGRANLVFIRCGNPERRVPNVRVTDIQLSPEGLIPHTNMVGVQFVVTLENLGTEPVRGLQVGLELDGQALSTGVVQVDVVEPGTSIPVPLIGEFGAFGGPRLLTAHLSGDALPGDNRFDKLILVRDRVRVLVIDGDLAWDNPNSFGADFVEVGLNPTQPPLRFRVRQPLEQGQSEYFVQPVVRTVREVSGADLSGKDIVYLCNVPVPTAANPRAGLTEDFITRLTEYVQNGGGLVIGCGSKVVEAEVRNGPPHPTTGQPTKVLAPYYNKVFGSEGAGLLPFNLSTDINGVVEIAPDLSPIYLEPKTIDELSFVAPFRQRYPKIFSQVRVNRLVRLDEYGPGSAGGRVLARTVGEKPFIVSRVVGAGEVVLIATAFDERWTDLVGIRSETWVSLNQYLMGHLTGRKVAGGNHTVADKLTRYPQDLSGSFDLVMPPRPGESSPRRTRLGPAQTPGLNWTQRKVSDATGWTLSGHRPAVSTTDTADPGVYRIVPEGQAPTADDPTYAVNADLKESLNLDMARENDLEKWLGFAPTVIQAGAGTETAVNQNRARREWTEWFLLGLLLLVIAESVWAWVCGRAW